MWYGRNQSSVQVDLHPQASLQYAVSPKYLRASHLISLCANLQNTASLKETYPALPMLTKVASVNLPSLTSASNHCFRSPAKDPENCVSGSMLCCLFNYRVSYIYSSAQRACDKMRRSGADESCKNSTSTSLCSRPRCLQKGCAGTKNSPPSCHYRYSLPRRVSMKCRRGRGSLPWGRHPNRWEVVRLPTPATA